YIFIALLGAMMVQRKAKWLMGAMGVLTFLGLCRAVRDIEQKKQEKWIVYHISKSSLVDFFDGQNAVALSDSLTGKQILFAAQPNRWASGIRDLQSVPF